MGSTTALLLCLTTLVAVRLRSAAITWWCDGSPRGGGHTMHGRIRGHRPHRRGMHHGGVTLVRNLMMMVVRWRAIVLHRVTLRWISLVRWVRRSSKLWRRSRTMNYMVGDSTALLRSHSWWRTIRGMWGRPPLAVHAVGMTDGGLAPHCRTMGNGGDPRVHSVT